MKIVSFKVSNFRGINIVEAGELGETIIVAGQNGSGKSCIFDAIRLLKSVYGGYQQNEWQHFFQEFQIQLQGGSKHLKGLFNDNQKEVLIRADFELRDREKAFISAHAAELLEESTWQSVLPEAFQGGGYHKAMFAAQFRDKQPEVTQKVNELLPLFLEELSRKLHVGQTTISPSGNITIENSIVLSVIFTNYRPREIGVIDFHGAQRHYGRESVQGINLSIDQNNQIRSQSSLYNYNAKYNNVKSEIAANFIKELLAKEASLSEAEGHKAEEVESLSEAMQELFASFFPDKKFLGPQPLKDGTLAFPVLTQSGTEHDLDELSSGEKEILYGYLRIRSSAPRDSIILLDEPELHLNPRLIRGLPEFYRKHLGAALQNQLWLVTHSDALIREAIGKPGFNVFHMLPCGADGANVSQMRPLVAFADLDLVLTDLVGDLAAYRPGGKGVIFEGGGDSDFDKAFVSALFSEEVRGINLISGTNKSKVRALHEVLARAHEKGDLPTKFYSVVDRDSDHSGTKQDGVTRFSWNVYHIENYLLEPMIIADVVNAFSLKSKMTKSDALERLLTAARLVVPVILVQQMKDFANNEVVNKINVSFDPATLTISTQLRQAIERSLANVQAAVGTLTEEYLLVKEKEIQMSIETSFGDGTWKENIPGREILKKFINIEQIPTNYESFRNQILSRMASVGHKPAGMKVVIDAIQRD